MDHVDAGIVFPKPKYAAGACKRGAKRALPAYGPYCYPPTHGENDWYAARDYPYERLDGQQYSWAG